MSDITVNLPDGSTKSLASGATVRDVAVAIGAGLAKAAIAGKVNGQLVDLYAPVADGARVEIIRHSTSHLMAQAVKRLYPAAKVTIGPAIESGFYYDFDVDHPFTPEELERIEATMRELAKADLKIQREELTSSEAIEQFRR